MCSDYTGARLEFSHSENEIDRPTRSLNLLHVSLPTDKYPAVSKDIYIYISGNSASQRPKVAPPPVLCTTAYAVLSCQTQAISNTSCFHFGELLDHPNISALEESPDTKAHVSEALLKGGASPRPDRARVKSTSCGLFLFPLCGKSPFRRSHCDDEKKF
jgi:hypothetical protein